MTPLKKIIWTIHLHDVGFKIFIELKVSFYKENRVKNTPQIWTGFYKKLLAMKRTLKE